jgi:hypothetical protein
MANILLVHREQGDFGSKGEFPIRKVAAFEAKSDVLKSTILES